MVGLTVVVNKLHSFEKEGSSLAIVVLFDNLTVRKRSERARASTEHSLAVGMNKSSAVFISTRALDDLLTESGAQSTIFKGKNRGSVNSPGRRMIMCRKDKRGGRNQATKKG